MKNPSAELTRRKFVQTTGLAAAMAAAGPTVATPAKAETGSKVRLGFIGVGGKGQHGLKIFQSLPNTEIVALCDVVEPTLAGAAATVGGDVATYHDFRELLAREDIDAVQIATPDHWHAIPLILAVQAGKGVYCEKPLARTVAEGRRMVTAANASGVPVQIGLQQRSGTHFQSAIDLVSSGGIGKVTRVECWINENHTPDGIGNPPDEAPPEGLDWDFWQGPAREHPYNFNRRVHFRWFWDYAGGKATDWGVHLMDIVLLATQQKAPRAVLACGGKYGLKDNRETPDTIDILWEFDGFTASFSHRNCNMNRQDKEFYGINFFGSDGTLYVNREGWKLTPERVDPHPGSPGYDKFRLELVEEGGSAQFEPHTAEFVNAVSEGNAEPLSGEIESAHRATSCCLIGNIALQTGQRLLWDSVAERFTNSEEANQLLDYGYRGEWAEFGA